MGDRYYLSLKCAKCGAQNCDVYYAASCGFEDFTCDECGTVNDINMFFQSSIQDPELKRIKQELEEEA